MSRDYLYGDAKATAKTGDASRKQRALQNAELAYKTEQSAKNRVALATALFDVGRFDEAEQNLKGLFDSGDIDIQLLTDLGFVYKNLDQNDKAKEMFLKAAELDPKHALARCAENEVWMMDPSYKPSWMRGDK